jgi:AraC-like DNA-binding protein
MAELTVSAGLARGLLDLAVSKGASRQALLLRAKIDPATLLDQDTRIPFVSYVALMRAGKELSGDAALALHYGEAIDLSDISIVGLIGRASQTMVEAFIQINRYGRLVVEVDTGGPRRFEVVQGAGGLWVTDTRDNPNDFIELTESTFTRMVCGCRRIIRESGQPVDTIVGAVHVTHQDPGYRAEYDRIFRASITFNSDRNAMLITDAWLNSRMAAQPRYAFGVLASHGDALLKSLADSKTLRGRVEALLMPILHTGGASADAVAGKLGVSRWTLFRRLKAEGITFEKLLDELRHKMAVTYLSAKKVSVNETAYLVGFSEPAAFSRAFKRWTGMNPRAYRAR